MTNHPLQGQQEAPQWSLYIGTNPESLTWEHPSHPPFGVGDVATMMNWREDRIAALEREKAELLECSTELFTALERARTTLQSIAKSLDKRTDHSRLESRSKAIGRTELIDRDSSRISARVRAISRTQEPSDGE